MRIIFRRKNRLVEIKYVKSIPCTWPDGSLGFPMPGHYYTMALVRGYAIAYEHNGTMYEMHTDSDGRTVLGPQQKIRQEIESTREQREKTDFELCAKIILMEKEQKFLFKKQFDKGTTSKLN